MLPLLVSALIAATPAPWQWRAAAGAQIDGAPHGVLDLGARKGPFSVELLTDTLDVRWMPRLDDGRWWMGLRGEALIAGLMRSPWTNGGPDETRALSASYVGLDAGRVVEMPGGLWGGIDASARVYLFGGTSATQIDVPETSVVTTGAGFLGWANGWAKAELRFEARIRDDAVGPVASLFGEVRPAWIIAPFIEVRAQLAAGLDDVTRTRLGGLNPYVVPLGGAGWAEWWVEDYAAARGGGRVNWGSGHAALFADVATFDGIEAYGLGLSVEQTLGLWFAQLSAGFAPNIERQDSITRLSGWILVGRRWGAF